jgi:hypothetical protein
MLFCSLTNPKNRFAIIKGIIKYNNNEGTAINIPKKNKKNNHLHKIQSLPYLKPMKQKTLA